jgi:predicted ATPase
VISAKLFIFLELGAVGDSRLVGQAIVAAFGLPIQSSDPIADLISHLVGKRALLILDSCEHVLSDVIELADRRWASVFHAPSSQVVSVGKR